MSKKGGYKILDLAGTNITVGTTGKSFPGIHAEATATKAAKLVSGLTVAGTVYDDCFVAFKASGNNLVGSAYGYTITIKNTDVVTVTTA